MNLSERQRSLDQFLLQRRDLWHPQPFRQVRPDWCDDFPALHAALLALSDEEVLALNGDWRGAIDWLAPHLPNDLPELRHLADLPARPRLPLAVEGGRWQRDIPGRKLAQIEAFAGSADAGAAPVLDWCGGKGHLGRLLAGHWGVPVTTLEIDPVLCEEGRDLARRSARRHAFICSDALNVAESVLSGHHAVALHACGELHRSLVRRAGAAGLAQLNVAPCCYHLGVAADYVPLTPGLLNRLSRDDVRLAVTETVTAAPRRARQSEREAAWKLGFAALRSEITGSDTYRSFKPVPAAWMRGNFSEFIALMLAREDLPQHMPANVAEFEQRGWQRQREVVRLSVLRHSFRRALEVWLALDLATCLTAQGYAVQLGEFCEARLTPRNLMLSARRAD